MPKSKNRKSQKAKSKSRSQQVKQAQVAYEKWVEKILSTPQPQFNPINPGANFVSLTGSDADKYQEEFLNGHKI